MEMQQIYITIIPSIIALFGVLISVVISLKRTRLLANTEMKKSEALVNTEIKQLRVDIQNLYTDKLLEKRLEVYPKLYSILSDFIKEIQFGNVTLSTINNLKNNIEKWDSENSFYLSGGATAKIYAFRRFVITELLLKNEEELKDKDYLEVMRNKAGDVEVALKNDVGIYKVEYSDIDKEVLSYKEHKEINRLRAMKT